MYEIHTMFSNCYRHRLNLHFLKNRITICSVKFRHDSQVDENSSKYSKWVEPVGYDTRVRIYNPLVKQKVNLVARTKNVLTWYSCGPTVYDKAHIGHGCCYITQDIIRRLLENVFNLNLVMVMGVTDIDDKIIARARELEQDFREVSQRYEVEFFQDMLKLNVKPPSMIARVSDHIPSIISFIQNIIENGYGYPVPDGSVYFNVEKYENYGKLVEAQEAIGECGDKQSPLDFALWKGVKPGEPFWESPWGPGRPGWHIECSAIASSLLGKCVDVHSGGVDLMFPHHENEEAQSCAHHGTQQWVNYWIHTGHLHLKGDVKMSKSLKNTVSIDDFLKKYTANEMRMFCLLSPYRNGMEYSEASMANSVALCNKLDNFLADCDSYIKSEGSTCSIDEPALLHKLCETQKIVEECLRDDFDTTRAMTHLVHLVTLTNTMLRQPATMRVGGHIYVVAAVAGYVRQFLDNLGFLSSTQSSRVEDFVLNSVLDSAISFRFQVRQTALSVDRQGSNEGNIKNELLSVCDNFRKELMVQGVEIKDQGKRTSWNMKKQPSLNKTNG